MNSRQLTLAAIRGEPHPRVPVAQHNFPFCVRYAGIKMNDYRRDPRVAAKVLADAAYDFGYDCIIMDVDTCTLAEAMGAKIVFPEDEPARVETPALATLEQIRDIPLPDPYRDGRLPHWLETVRELRRIVGDEKAIMGRADQGPFGVLFQLRGHETFMMDLIDQPEALLAEALNKCVDAGVRFAQAQMEVGSDLTSIGDSAAGQSLVSPDFYARFAQPYERRYKELLGPAPLAIHICGKTNDIIGGMLDTGAEVFELDHWNDFDHSLAVANNRASLWGNIDPSSVLSRGSRQDVLDACRKVLEAGKRRTWKFALCPGCVANADVPPENIRAMTEAAQQWGVYEQPPG